MFLSHRGGGKGVVGGGGRGEIVVIYVNEQSYRY